MTALKTQENDGNVKAFLNEVEDEQKRKDCFVLLELIQNITGEQPKMWGPSIVGFGSYHYKYESGREGNWFLTGFSPRKQNITVYIMPGFERYKSLTEKLGKFTTGKSCLYFKKLEHIDQDVLAEMISESVAQMKKEYS